MRRSNSPHSGLCYFPVTYRNRLDAACPNCQTPLLPTDHYCHQCGQSTASRNVPLRVLLAEWWVDELGVDGKLIRTLRLLMSQPGELTRRWIAGQRRHFTDPLKLYFLLAVVYVVIYQQEMSIAFDAQFAAQKADLTKGNPRTAAIMTRVIDAYYNVMVAQMDVLLLLSVPVFAWASRRMLRRLDPLYVHHLVGALHLYALTMVVGIICAPIGILVSREWEWGLAYGMAFIWSVLYFKRLYRLDADTLTGVVVGAWGLSAIATGFMFIVAWVVNFLWLTYAPASLWL